MPAPTYRLTQTIPACPDGAPTEIDGTELDRGNVLVNEDCCRRYAPRLNVTIGSVTRTLFLESDVPTCSQTAPGEKIFSSDAYQLCAGPAGKQWTISFPCPTCPCAAFEEPPVGVWVGGNVSFNVAGPISGTAYSTVDLENRPVFEGLSAQTFRDELLAMGFAADQFSVTAVWSPTRRYVINFANAVAPSSLTLDESTLNDSGAVRTCDATLSGPTSGRVRVDAYLRAAWSSCSLGGLVIEERNVATDSVIAEYGNDHYAMKHGIRTNLARRWALQSCEHPCGGLLTAAQVRGLHPPAYCAQPALAQTRCLAGVVDLDVIATYGEGNGPGAAASGFVAHVQHSTANFGNRFSLPAWSAPPVPIEDAVSFNMVGHAMAYIGAGIATMPARLTVTMSAGTVQHFSALRACLSRFNAGTGKFESAESPAYRSVDSLFSQETGPYFLNNSLQQHWAITGGTCTIRHPDTGEEIPELDFPGTKTFTGLGGSTASGGLFINGRYAWEADSLPTNCGGLEWMKTDETLHFIFNVNVHHVVYFFSDDPLLLSSWTPGTYTHSNFLPSSAVTSPGTGLSHEA